MAVTFLSIGSNSGDRDFYLRQSILWIEQHIGNIIQQSDIYETQAWGYDGQNFLNMVVKVETTLTPAQVMHSAKSGELEMGRVRVPGKYTDRTIDMDILFYEKEVISDENLVIPHPRLHERLFVLEPLMDIEPEFRHPLLNKTISQLREECNDEGWIRKFS